VRKQTRASAKKTALVTGGSSGIGLAAARGLILRGYKVYSLSRSAEQMPDGLVQIPCDVSDCGMMTEAVRGIVEAEGQLNLLVACAGYGISGPVETTDINDAMRQFDVNYFGAVNAITACLPFLRKTGGRIVAVSSVAGVLPVPFQAHYSASKAALNALVISLRGELRKRGVTICAVMPGDTRTGFTAARIKSKDSGVYTSNAQRSIARMERDEQSGMSPEAAAAVIIKAAEKKRPRPFYIAGRTYSLLYFLSKLLPVSLVSYIETRMYS